MQETKVHSYDQVDAGNRLVERRKTRHLLINVLACKRVLNDELHRANFRMRSNDSDLEASMAEIEGLVMTLRRAVNEALALSVDLEALS